MKFLHFEIDASGDETIFVSLDNQANVRLMDTNNFYNYKNGRRYQFIGGRAVRSPCALRAPHAGQWHVVVDLGGYSGRVNASVRVA